MGALFLVEKAKNEAGFQAASIVADKEGGISGRKINKPP
jgi:hypothetical protein